MKGKTTKNLDQSFSIAIPVYNQVETIDATIKSVLFAVEGATGIEVVISDNHSTDGTSEIVDKYKDLVKIIRPNKHLAMPENWNYAVRGCTGEWIGMLSGDDRIYPNYIPAMRAAITKYPSAVFAIGGWNNYDVKTGKRYRKRVLSLPSVVKTGRATKSLIYGPKASFSAYCFLKSAFDSIGGFPEEYNLIQDWILQFNLSLIGGFTVTKAIVAEYNCNQPREELEQKRVPLLCQDLANFCVSQIWKASYCGTSKLKIINACEIHMERAENLLTLYPHHRLKCDAILKPVYELIGKHRVALRQSKKPNAIATKSKAMLRWFAENAIPG